MLPKPRKGEYERHQRALFKAIGRDGLVDDQRYATMGVRAERQEEVDSIVEEWSMKHTKYRPLPVTLGYSWSLASLIIRPLANSPQRHYKRP